MADAADSKSAALKSVWVQVPPSARPCILIDTGFFTAMKRPLLRGRVASLAVYMRFPILFTGNTYDFQSGKRSAKVPK